MTQSLLHCPKFGDHLTFPGHTYACGICITITRYWRSVEAKDLEFSHPDNTPALHGFSFRIRHGESVAIVGANGAGKSSLLLHLNGYLTPTSGQVRIGDFPLTKETQHCGSLFYFISDSHSHHIKILVY